MEVVYHFLKWIVVLVSLWKKKTKQWKEVKKKIQPGKPVAILEDFKDEENHQALEPTPCSSTRKRSKKAHEKSSKKNKHILSDFSSESESDQEV